MALLTPTKSTLQLLCSLKAQFPSLQVHPYQTRTLGLPRCELPRLEYFSAIALKQIDFALASRQGASIKQAGLTQLVDKFVKQSAHQPPTIIWETAGNYLPGTSQDDRIAGVLYRGRVHRFLDQIPNRAEAIAA